MEARAYDEIDDMDRFHYVRLKNLKSSVRFIYQIARKWHPHLVNKIKGSIYADLDLVWRYLETRGKGIKVAVLDSGIDDDHQLLTHAIRESRCFIGMSSNCHDEADHGTHVAGIIAARGRPGKYMGIAPEVELYIGKVLDSRTNGAPEDVQRGIDWAIDRKVQIINLSLSSQSVLPKVREKLQNAIKQGIVVVCSAGRAPYELQYPGKYEELITVGTSHKNNPADGFPEGPEIDVIAPGVNIKSTDHEGKFVTHSGTSQSAPIVTGFIALYLAKYREELSQMEPHTIHSIIESTIIDSAKQIDFEGGKYSLFDPIGFLYSKPKQKTYE